MANLNYQCNGCDALITERDKEILTGIIDGKRVFYHTQYPASVRDKTTSGGLALAFMSGILPCSSRFEQKIERPQRIKFNDIEKLVVAGDKVKHSLSFRIGRIKGAVGNQKFVIVREGDNLVYYAHELTSGFKSHEQIKNTLGLSKPFGGRWIGYSGVSVEDLLINNGSCEYGGVPDRLLVPNRELILAAYQHIDPRIKTLHIKTDDDWNIVRESNWEELI